MRDRSIRVFNFTYRYWPALADASWCMSGSGNMIIYMNEFGKMLIAQMLNRRFSPPPPCRLCSPMYGGRIRWESLPQEATYVPLVKQDEKSRQHIHVNGLQ